MGLPLPYPSHVFMLCILMETVREGSKVGKSSTTGLSMQGANVKPCLEAVQEIVGLLEEVEGVDEDDGHAAALQVP